MQKLFCFKAVLKTTFLTLIQCEDTDRDLFYPCEGLVIEVIWNRKRFLNNVLLIML